ncbi:uncharacterized protein LOC110448948 [Mizuhopecten yessoensis]|uniref:uncharacterized protein LOC110448948 n=1 Tax=Mizuhopecten yessoensis TaxID=6573 RepID=UPI000B45EAC5|nr:uncharacterized protein LOC110448948 [Mizuhopecten yessoensis]XP_021351145.1 uncharacterized protein LOC110448948 [Mizuhopecten yessoensis]
MASENVSVGEQLRNILSLLEKAEHSLTNAKTLLEPLLGQIPASTNDEPLRNIKGRTRSRADSGYTESVDSAVINPTSVTSISLAIDNLQVIPEICPRPKVENSSELEDIQTPPVLMRSRSERDNLSNSGPVPYRRSGSEHDDRCRRKESDEETSS